MRWLGPVAWLVFVFGLVSVVARATTPQAPPCGPFRLPQNTALRIWNDGVFSAPYVVSLREGPEDGGGREVYSDTVSLAPGEGRDYDVGRLPQVPQGFEGHAVVDAGSEIGYEYYLSPWRPRAVTTRLHNVLTATITVTVRYRDNAGQTLAPTYTLAVAACQEERFRLQDYPAPNGWADVEFAANGPFERYAQARVGYLSKE